MVKTRILDTLDMRSAAHLGTNAPQTAAPISRVIARGGRSCSCAKYHRDCRPSQAILHTAINGSPAFHTTLIIVLSFENLPRLGAHVYTGTEG